MKGGGKRFSFSKVKEVILHTLFWWVRGSYLWVTVMNRSLRMVSSMDPEVMVAT